eukprot:10321232-Karenia_brevis.AAC.1
MTCRDADRAQQQLSYERNTAPCLKILVVQESKNWVSIQIIVHHGISNCVLAPNGSGAGTTKNNAKK